MPNTDYDLIIIGAGPAGESAAVNAAKNALRTAVIDEHSQVGGGCTHQGTIPSKALRSSINTLIRFNTNPLFHNRSKVDISFPQLMQNVDDVIRKQVSMRTKFYSRNQIDLHHGRCEFVDKHTIKLIRSDGVAEQLSAKSFLIACGSRPYRPDDIDFNHSRVFDSDTILKLKATPKENYHLWRGCHRL